MHAEQVLYFFNYCLTKLVNLGKNPSKIPVKTILVVKLDEIGDMVYALPVFKFLKERYPESELTLYCRKVAATLLRHERRIDQISFEQPKLDFDLVVELRGDFKTLLKSIISPPKMRLDRGTVRYRNRLKGRQTHELITNISVLDPLKLVIPEIEKLRPEIVIGPENLKSAMLFIEENKLEKYCLVHTGARDPARRWPFERYIELSTKIKTELNLNIVFVGGSEERAELEDNLKKFTFPVYSFAGKGNLLDYAALCSKAALFVGNESGPMHIANTFDIPLLALFGPGVKDVFYPLGKHAKVIHYFKESNHTEQTADDTTMLKISVDEAWEGVLELMKNEGK